MDFVSFGPSSSKSTLCLPTTEEFAARFQKSKNPREYKKHKKIGRCLAKNTQKLPRQLIDMHSEHLRVPNSAFIPAVVFNRVYLRTPKLCSQLLMLSTVNLCVLHYMFKIVVQKVFLFSITFPYLRDLQQGILQYSYFSQSLKWRGGGGGGWATLLPF